MDFQRSETKMNPIILEVLRRHTNPILKVRYESGPVLTIVKFNRDDITTPMSWCEVDFDEELSELFENPPIIVDDIVME